MVYQWIFQGEKLGEKTSNPMKSPFITIESILSVFLKPKSPRHQDGFYWARSQNAPDLVRRGVSVCFC